MFEDKSIDPRTCTYRLLASSKLRKQIDRLIRTKKLQFGLINPKSDSVDFYNQFHSASYSNNQNLVNRTSRNSKKKVNDENVHTDEGDKEQSTIIIAKIEQIEVILHRADDEQKQTFTYNDLIELHRLLQHLDPSEHMNVAKEYFYEFLEGNFRVMQLPERRTNLSLDERLRKLRFKAASDEYDSMVHNVAHYVIGNNRIGARFSMSQDFRQIRSTLLAAINAMMVIAATFFFFYVTIHYARPDFDTGKVVLYSFGASMVVAMAELYFLIRII
ncbi:uncharacterized protein LOC124498886 [Dermatophagoides farinae]|uniref:Transmembrane protein 199 n=1 Tax=Dermatophagoides farinae TaxID=6954 RepID=A0A922I055_DERFA|nr:uncharacterized protein LOC124498886 [Dermatophagoides farinae]KAH7645946.1 hypothetical protein HUG17_1484 [Dermatophagoides farinae]KAH9516227.1 hypothetical protein DERF_006981 [Dermatophagoides farinae]